MHPENKEKLDKLRKNLRYMESVVIAFSGGVDSTFLLKVAVEVLGDKALAVTATSSTYPAQEQAEAQKLARELGARHKLIVSEELDIEGFAENPTNRCLSSRFPYSSRITKEKLNQVDRGEMLLRSLGFQQFRLRHHGEIARIEIPRDQFLLMVEKVDQVVEELKACGFTYVTMDLQGYRTGSMNETLKEEDKRV